MLIKVEQARDLLNQVEEELAEAREHVRELETLGRFLRKQIERNVATTPMLPIADTERPDYSEMSLPDAMQDILRRAGRPLHVRQIAKQLVDGGKEDKDHLTISVTSAARRRNDVFVQTARATFALRNGEH